MANDFSILERYGIKEVCDVTFYEIVEDDNGQIVPGKPVLYLDTLKVSTVEQTAENVSARGGKGNPELVVWDYGKEITLNLEDAVFSSKSLALMFGTVPKVPGDYTKLKKVLPKSQLKYDSTAGGYKYTMHGQEYIVAAGDITWYNMQGAEAVEKTVEAGGSLADVDYAEFEVELKEQSQIDINSDTFPGTYYVTGDTYARSEKDGEDEFLQLIIPKAKMLSEVTLTMEAEGDPSTFNMSMKVLRPTDKNMMKLIKYDVKTGNEDNGDEEEPNPNEPNDPNDPNEPNG